jgi:hypothetical protein
MAGGVAVFNVALQVPAAAQAFRDSLARDKCWQAQGAAIQQMKNIEPFSQKSSHLRLRGGKEPK